MCTLTVTRGIGSVMYILRRDTEIERARGREGGGGCGSELIVVNKN